MLSLWLKDKQVIVAITFILAVLLGLSGCGHSSKQSTVPHAEKILETLDEIAFLELASEYFIEANAALRRGDSAVALRYFETAFMLDTNSEILYNKVIEISIATGRPASAVNIIQRGRHYSQMSDTDLRKIASIFLNYHSYVQAFEAIEAVKEKTRADTIFLFRLSMAESLAIAGAIYNSRGHYDSALVVLNNVLNMGVKTPNILFELGMANERMKNYDEAEKHFREILRIHPRHALAANYLAYMWAENNVNLEEAEALILIALEEEPDNGAFLDSHGWILYKQGRYEEALPPLLQAEERIKDDYVVYYHLGAVYLKLGDREKALKHFVKANEFDDNPDFERIKMLIDSIKAELF